MISALVKIGHSWDRVWKALECKWGAAEMTEDCSYWKNNTAPFRLELLAAKGKIMVCYGSRDPFSGIGGGLELFDWRSPNT